MRTTAVVGDSRDGVDDDLFQEHSLRLVHEGLVEHLAVVVHVADLARDGDTLARRPGPRKRIRTIAA